MIDNPMEKMIILDVISHWKYKYLASTQAQRETADYDAIDEIDERIARKRIKQAEEFIEEAKRFI